MGAVCARHHWQRGGHTENRPPASKSATRGMHRPLSASFITQVCGQVTAEGRQVPPCLGRGGWAGVGRGPWLLQPGTDAWEFLKGERRVPAAPNCPGQWLRTSGRRAGGPVRAAKPLDTAVRRGPAGPQGPAPGKHTPRPGVHEARLTPGCFRRGACVALWFPGGCGVSTP